MNNGVQDQKNRAVRMARGRLVLLMFTLVSIGGSIGWVAASDLRPPAPPVVLPRNNAIRSGGYQFTNPLLIDSETSVPNPALLPLKNKIYQGTYDLLNNSQVDNISFYFKDLTTGRWTGINEGAIYDSASLLKVPLMIAYFKKAELDSTLFSQRIKYLGEPEDNKGIEFYNLKPGTEYTVGDLLDYMIVKSDNSAKDLLINYLDKDFQNQVFKDLGMTIPDPNQQYQISPKQYALFFRLLYNATYLTDSDSEAALQMLSNSEYQDGLVAGVPSSTQVAHKFGQYGIPSGNGSGVGTWELHDCGIVYHPERPYLLCVMTRGEDLTKLSGLIKTASQITYQEVDSNFQ